MKNKGKGNFFISVHEAYKYIEPLRKEKKTLVTTNGCFDLLHSGHIQYLYEASLLGDILAVGVNADATVKKLKGAARPFQSEKDRGAIVAALTMVDCAFLFPEDDPRAFLEILRPDVHVKGGDYTEDIIEKQVVEKYGGVVKIVSLVPGYSTTSIAEKIRKLI